MNILVLLLKFLRFFQPNFRLSFQNTSAPSRNSSDRCKPGLIHIEHLSFVEKLGRLPHNIFPPALFLN